MSDVQVTRGAEVSSDNHLLECSIRWQCCQAWLRETFSESMLGTSGEKTAQNSSVWKCLATFLHKGLFKTLNYGK